MLGNLIADIVEMSSISNMKSSLSGMSSRSERSKGTSTERSSELGKSSIVTSRERPNSLSSGGFNVVG